ncbi:Uncharacterised protein [Mycobacteroides abscessus subsp. massiliense]|nr:Uncharacterised protein [Mycobacteroides abscessus subsp. massiliense]
MTHPHHDAAGDHQRSGRKTELLAAEQHRDHHVTAGLELAVDLHDDAVTQTIEQQRLLRLGQAELPRRTRMFHGRQRSGSGSTVVSGDEYHVGMGLGNTRGNRANTVLRHQLHVDACLRVGVLQIVDQLR